jgi:hypothetical protein
MMARLAINFAAEPGRWPVLGLFESTLVWRAMDEKLPVEDRADCSPLAILHMALLAAPRARMSPRSSPVHAWDIAQLGNGGEHRDARASSRLGRHWLGGRAVQARRRFERCRPRATFNNETSRERTSTNVPAMPRATRTLNPRLNHRIGPSLRQFDHFIPVCNGVNQALGATDQIDGSQSNRTGPASRQLQDKSGGVAPAGLLLIERSVAAPEVMSTSTVGCRSTPWNRSPISYGAFGKGASPRPIPRLRLRPKTVIDRVWPILSASCRPTIKSGTAGVDPGPPYPGKPQHYLPRSHVGSKGERHKPSYRSVTPLDARRLPTFN